MKKTALLSFLILLLPLVSHAETVSLKLRASRNPGSVRVVLQGPENVIAKGSVTRKDNDILVTFPGISISIQAEKEIVAHRMINKETLRISPGDFSGMKVFTLKEPPRLVIDAYSNGDKGDDSSVAPQKKETDATAFRTNKIVIDAGHGGYEDGIVRDSSKEKNTVLDISRKLGLLVNSTASRGFLTRDIDRFMPLGERVNFANSKAADVFISLHIGEHRDIVIYTPVVTERQSDSVRQYLLNRGQQGYEKETLVLLKSLSEAVIPAFGEDMLSVKPLPYTIISRIEAAALIIELPSYEYASYSEEYNSKIADTIFKGLNNYEEAKNR